MSERFKKSKELARQYFLDHALSNETQSRISLFLQSFKIANLVMLTKVEIRPLDWRLYRFFHAQYFKEAEFAILLSRTTKWSLNPRIYVDASKRSLMLWKRGKVGRRALSSFNKNLEFLEYLALSHALMSEIRFIPLFPPIWDLMSNAFLNALNEVEEENGRQMQVQIRLLKELESPLTVHEKTKLIEVQRGIVRDLFADFLESLAGQKVGALQRVRSRFSLNRWSRFPGKQIGP